MKVWIVQSCAHAKHRPKHDNTKPKYNNTQFGNGRNESHVEFQSRAHDSHYNADNSMVAHVANRVPTSQLKIDATSDDIGTLR